MEKKLTIYYTSDIHGCFSPIDYATGLPADSGLANCMAQFRKDGNTLVIDGGDTLQGSPLTYYLSHEARDVTTLPAVLLNLGGYDFVTLGNHDFDYGKQTIERYLAALNARCLCANVGGYPRRGENGRCYHGKWASRRPDRYYYALCHTV